MKHRIIGTIAAAMLVGGVLLPAPASAAPGDPGNDPTDCSGTLPNDETECVIAVAPPAQSAPEPTDTPPPDGATTIDNPATVDTPVASSDGGTVPLPEPAPAAPAPATFEPVVAGQGGTVPSSVSAQSLPETGSYSSGILLIGTLLLLAGAAALFAARHRDPEPSV